MSARPFGILNLERGLPAGTPSPNPRYAALLDFPVISETIEGGWAEPVIRGDASLTPAFVAAARRLVERGAVAIGANCGFSIRQQEDVAAAVKVPVALSSLLLLPMILRQVPRTTKVAVVTADSTNLSEDLLGLDDPADRARIVIGGIEGGELLRNEMLRPPPITPIESIQKDVEECVAHLRAKHPDISAMLFECTGFPMVAPALRRSTNLPIYDVADLCRITYASVS
jgi:hypothetical protein